MNTTRRLFLAGAAGLPWIVHPGFAATHSASDIITAVERLRDPVPAYRMFNTIVQYQDGQETGRIKVAVFTKLDNATGKWRDIVQYIDPPRDARKTLVNDGAALWFYDPASRASLRISAQQRLTGQASNGDVLTTNYGRDYNGKLLGEETVKDADKVAKECWHLDLTPKTADAVYGRLEYWIEKSTSAIIKGKCYADSGQLLKLVFYRDQKPALGGIRPMQTILIDGVDPRLVTTMTFSDFREASIPDSWFQRAYLSRIDAS